MWTKLDDGLESHQKLTSAALAVRRPASYTRVLGAFTLALLHANRYLTDGFVPDTVFAGRAVPQADVDALVASRLLHRDEERRGYVIHDFHDWNPRASQVKERQAWDRERKALYGDKDLVESIRARDQDRCRYCGRVVSWHDRRGDGGGQFDHVVPRGGNTYANVVVACRGCNNRKGPRTPEQAGMTLRPEPGREAESEPEQNQVGPSSDLVAISPSRARDHARGTRPVPDPSRPEERSSPADRPGALRGREFEGTQPPAGAKSPAAAAAAHTRIGFARTVERPAPRQLEALIRAERERYPDADTGDFIEHCKVVCARAGLVYDSRVLHSALDTIAHADARRRATSENPS